LILSRCSAKAGLVVAVADAFYPGDGRRFSPTRHAAATLVYPPIAVNPASSAAQPFPRRARLAAAAERTPQEKGEQSDGKMSRNYLATLA
jgi:hypothetical protein